MSETQKQAITEQLDRIQAQLAQARTELAAVPVSSELTPNADELIIMATDSGEAALEMVRRTLQGVSTFLHKLG